MPHNLIKLWPDTTGGSLRELALSAEALDQGWRRIPMRQVRAVRTVADGASWWRRTIFLALGAAFTAAAFYSLLFKTDALLSKGRALHILLAGPLLLVAALAFTTPAFYVEVETDDGWLAVVRVRGEAFAQAIAAQIDYLRTHPEETGVFRIDRKAGNIVRVDQRSFSAK